MSTLQMTQQDDVELGQLSPTGSTGLTTMQNEADGQLKGDDFDDDLDFSSDSDSDPEEESYDMREGHLRGAGIGGL